MRAEHETKYFEKNVWLSPSGATRGLFREMILWSVLLMFVGCFVGLSVNAQTLVEEKIDIVRAEVLHATEPVTAELPGLHKESQSQDVTAKIEEGSDTGRVVTFTNDYVMLKSGETFFIKLVQDTHTGAEFISVADPYRLHVLGWLALLFLAICIGVGRWQGFRGVVSLVASVASIYYILIPLILAGYSPVFSALLVASLIVVLGSYITHGVSRTTSAAVLGMVVTITLAGFLAEYVIYAASLTGYSADESVFLSMNSGGTLSLVALLLGGILIGLLGVLYDSAIGQAIAVEELYRSGQAAAVQPGLHAASKVQPHSTSYIFSRAMRIGREHIGALVNTLAIAYVGASLPLLLLVSQASTAPLLVTLNSEVFATEIIRILIGSIGIIATVPITTYIAVWLLKDVKFVGTNAQAHSRSHSHSHRH